MATPIGPPSNGSADRPSTVKSISELAVGKGPGRGCMAVFFGIFLAAGLAFLSLMVLLPAWRLWESRTWVEVPCTIEEIGVETHPGSDGATYSIAVRFTYEVEGISYDGGEFDFGSGSDSDRDSKQEGVDRYSPGSESTCWVNPQDPTEAVVERRLGQPWWLALIMLPFVAVGAGGLVWVLFFMGRSRERGAPDWVPDEAEPVQGGAGPLILEPEQTPVGKLVRVLIFCLLWNGMLAFPVYKIVEGWRDGNGDGCITAFLVPFVLVGLLLLISIPYQFLALFNPRPELTLVPGRLAPGETAQLSWRFSGAAGRIRKLTLSLEGVEEATYRRGTNSHTDSNTFSTQDLMVVEGPMLMARGQALVSLPEGTMHSFEAPNNRIVWTLKLHGEIPFWPDVSEEFEIGVVPREELW